MVNVMRIGPRNNSENVIKIFWCLWHWRGWRKRQSQHQGNSFKENAPLQGKTQGTIITWEGEGTTGEPFRTSENEQGTLKVGLVLKISNSFLDQRSSSLFVCQVWQPGWSDDNSWQFLAPLQFNKSQQIISCKQIQSTAFYFRILFKCRLGTNENSFWSKYVPSVTSLSPHILHYSLCAHYLCVLVCLYLCAHTLTICLLAIALLPLDIDNLPEEYVVDIQQQVLAQFGLHFTSLSLS